MMMPNKNILVLFLGAVGFIAIVAVSWYVYTTMSAPTYSIKNTPRSVLAEQNQDYTAATAFKKEGKYDLALESYKKALASAEDQFQIAQIRFNIAGMNEELGNYKEAIAELKEIAADTTNHPVARANSVQEMGLMYYVNTDTSVRETIVAETFKDEPYYSLRIGNSLNMAYTKLFEYAGNLYPIGLSETRIAYGYTNELLNTLKGATSTPQGKAYISIIMQSLQAADADIDRMKNIPGEAALIPETLIREGSILGRLATAGVADPKQAEPYFKAGLAFGVTLGYKPGSFNTFNYAAFLVDQYGTTRVADIRTVLSAFRVGNEANIYPDVANFYKTARADTSLAKSKKQIIAMGRMDASFKIYLISLGWKSSDF
ncbi:MAG: tetratricopeptide repeat protein [Minisyncoccia bacterium]